MFLYLYARTASQIHDLKAEARTFRIEEIYPCYRDGYTYWDIGPGQRVTQPGWISDKMKVERLVSSMSPRHERWREYRNAKRRATILLAARLILKANNGIVPAKEEIGPFVSMGIVRSHARTASEQKGLAFAAYRQLRKLDNRLRKQPERFADVESWLRQRESEVRHD